MPTSIIRDCGTFNISPPQRTPELLSVGETWIRSAAARGVTALEKILPVARQIRPYMQTAPQASGFTARTVAEHMIGTKGWSVAYLDNAPGNVLAFSSIRQIRPQLHDRMRGVNRAYYAFDQFGVTAGYDLREPLGMTPDGHYLKAAAALLLCAIKTLPAKSPVYVVGYPNDTRDGYFFRNAGFQPTPDMPHWGRSDASMCASAGAIAARLCAIPGFCFLRRPVTQ